MQTQNKSKRRYGRPASMTELCLWGFDGDEFTVMCLTGTAPDGTCGSTDCYGCPAAMKKVNGKVEYWRTPIFGKGDRVANGRRVS